MAVVASINFIEPASAELVSLANYAEESSIETLHCVAGVLDYYKYHDNNTALSPAAAEASIDALLGVVLDLARHCPKEGDNKLFNAVEIWLCARGRF